MARPPFTLSDDQARQLAVRVAALQATYPYDSRNHRPFVRGFMRAVQEVTGQLYSPAIYQRLLSAFASERRPSTATLAAEKQVLANEEAIRPVESAGDAEDGFARPVIGPSQLHAIVSDAVDAALSRTGRLAATSSSQVDFYASRLRQTEQELMTVRAEAARLVTELAVARMAATNLEQEADRLREAFARQVDTVDKLVIEVTDHRKFAMQSIDEARGESRVWKERCAALEEQRKLDAQLLETFRQQSYRAGGAIPDVLRQNKPR